MTRVNGFHSAAYQKLAHWWCTHPGDCRLPGQRGCGPAAGL